MKTVIIYMSNHGNTSIVVDQLKEKLGSTTTDVVNLKTNSSPDLTNYSRVIIGGSIHAGKIQRKIREFCQKEQATLLQKKVGLFICCMYEGDAAQKQLLDAFPPEIHQHSEAEAILGGGLNFEKMNFVERVLIKKIANQKESTIKIDHEAIKRFVLKMDRTFHPLFSII